MQNITSKIQQVTVFRDRAQINRTTEINLAVGEHTLVFPHLPRDIRENSIRVGVNIKTGRILLKEVKLKSMFFAQEQSENLRILEEETQALEDKIALGQAKESRLKAQKTFVENIAKKSTSIEEASSSSSLNPDTWLKMLAFHQSQLETLDTALWTLQKEISSHTSKITLLKNKTQSIRQNSTKEQKAIQIVVNVKEATKAILKVSYVIRGANWTPLYDVRVDTETKKVDLSYQALVQQKTGEDWTDVRLALSTATPHISSKMPTLSPHYIGIYEHSRGSEIAASVSYSVDIDESMDFEEEETTIESKGTSVLFHIGGNSTIESNNQKHKVGISLFTMDSDLYYMATPALRQRAYLYAKVTNTSNFSLLAGDMNVFADNHFIATTAMEFRGVGEFFEFSIGVDEAIKVIHKEINDHRSNEGIIGMRKTVRTVTANMNIENNRTNDIKILVLASYPYATDSKINVELLKPSYTKKTAELTQSKEHILTWTLHLKAGEKRELPLEYVLSFPRGEILNF